MAASMKLSKPCALRLHEELDDVEAVSTSRSNIANVLVFQGRTDASNLDREDVRVCRDLTHRTDTTRAITLSNRGAALATENASRRLFPVSACRQNN